jgi:hypothetical protein
MRRVSFVENLARLCVFAAFASLRENVFESGIVSPASEIKNTSFGPIFYADL